jgi:hypothetical protein
MRAVPDAIVGQSRVGITNSRNIAIADYQDGQPGRLPLQAAIGVMFPPHELSPCSYSVYCHTIFAQDGLRLWRLHRLQRLTHQIG